MSSPELAGDVSLCAVARNAIAFGLRERRQPSVDPLEHPTELREPGAAFVTIRCQGELRGCTGSLEASLPLVCDVARNAWRAAFADPRFRPLSAVEFDVLEIHVSVLGPLVPLPARSERELLAALRPGVDGLVLREGAKSATFLPAVWESLPGPRDFLQHLLVKAGLPPSYWSDTLRFQRYTVTDAA